MKANLIKSGAIISMSMTLSACVVTPAPVYVRPAPVYVRPAPAVYVTPVYVRSRIYF